MACGALERAVAYNCPTPLPGGIGGDSRLVLYNFSEISFTESGSTPGLRTAMTLSSGASGYQMQGYKVSLKPSVDAVDDQAGVTRWKQRVAFIIFANDQLTKNTIQRMALGRYVAIYENNGKNADSFEIMGINSGLIMKPQKVRDLQENSSAYLILLETPDNELEPNLPATFYSSSYASTLSAVNTTLYLPTVTNISDLTISTGGGDAETITGTNFYGSLASASEVVSLYWINQATQARTQQTSFTVASATSISLSSVALAAGLYALEVTTKKGIAVSTLNVTVS
jgi:hypothetical protein